VEIFSAGLGNSFAVFGLPPGVALTLGALTVSTFLLTTLDTCTRLSRFILQELLGLAEGWKVRILASVAVVVLPGIAVFLKIPGANGAPLPAWQAVWPAFGATNQLLAALALLVLYAWQRSLGRRALWALIPFLFMLGTTVVALVQLVLHHASAGSPLIAGFSAFLLLLAGVLVVHAFAVLRRKRANG